MDVQEGSGRGARTEFVASYEGSTTTLKAARDDVDTWLRERGVGEGGRQRIALVVSELASNAVQAAPEVPYDVSIAHTDGVVEVTVVNVSQGSSVPPRDAWGPDDVLAPRGRGLSIVEALAEDMVVDESRLPIVTIRATMRTTG